MGVVHRGVDITTMQPVAVKTLQPAAFNSPKARERFHREATVVSKMSHPGVAQILDFGIEDNIPFLVMELVDGPELAEVLAHEGPLPPARAVNLTRQLVSVLKAAHDLKLVHRDIKPANLRLLTSAQGEATVLKVLDFGIAKEIGQEQGKLTSTGAIMGTPLYLAPEQASDAGGNVDGRTDQYQAGVVLYELLTGHVPFSGQTVASILLSHLIKPPPPLPTLVPEQLRRVVLRMLKKDPADRFPDDEALDKALASCEAVCAGVPAVPLELSLPEEKADKIFFQKWGVVSFALLCTLVLGAGAWYRVWMRRSEHNASTNAATSGVSTTAAPATANSDRLPVPPGATSDMKEKAGPTTVFPPVSVPDAGTSENHRPPHAGASSAVPSSGSPPGPTTKEPGKRNRRVPGKAVMTTEKSGESRPAEDPYAVPVDRSH